MRREGADRLPKCRTRIRGYFHVPGVISFTGDYTPPRFCDSCGAPFPWLDRQGRIFELENMLDDEDPMMPRSSQSASSSARSPIPTSTRTRSASAAPGLWEKSGGRAILETVVSAAIRGQLGLPTA